MRRLKAKALIVTEEKKYLSGVIISAIVGDSGTIEDSLLDAFYNLTGIDLETELDYLDIVPFGRYCIDSSRKTIIIKYIIITKSDEVYSLLDGEWIEFDNEGELYENFNLEKSL